MAGARRGGPITACRSIVNISGPGEGREIVTHKASQSRGHDLAMSEESFRRLNNSDRATKRIMGRCSRARPPESAHETNGKLDG